MHQKGNNIFNKEFVIGGISQRELLTLAEQLHAGVKAGYSIVDSIKLAHSQSRARMKQVLSDVLLSVGHGAYLYESFEKHDKYFPPVFLSLLRNGELSASLEESLDEIRKILKKDLEFSQKIKSASIYPIFVFVSIVGLGLSVSIFVLPSILPLFQSLGTELPTSTKVLLWIAEVFDKYGFEIGTGSLLFVIFLVWFLKRKASRVFTHWVLIKLPFFGKLYRKIIMTAICRSMHSLLKSGVTIDEALMNTSESLGNIYYQKSLKDALPQIGKGDTMSTALRESPELYDELFLNMLFLGESTASLEQAFDNIAEYFEAQVDNETKNLLTSLEPILLIIVGLIVGFVALAILGPIYSISGSIR